MNIHQIALIFVDFGLGSTYFKLFSCLRIWKETPPEARWDGKNCPLEMLSTGYKEMLGLLCSKIQQLGIMPTREKSISVFLWSVLTKSRETDLTFPGYILLLICKGDLIAAFHYIKGA